MMKFFRKYNKQMLAVFMVLLLIVWLAGDALQYFLNPDVSGHIMATSVHGEINNAEWNEATKQTEWLGRMGLNWQFPLGMQAQPLDLASWVMLTREAHQMGIRSSRAVVQSVLTQRQLGEAAVLRMAQLANVKTDVIYDAGRAYTDVLRHLGKMSQASQVNEAELRKAAEDTLHKVQVKAVVLRAETFEDPETTFSEAEIQEQFDKHKDKKPSGSGLNFGYMLPPRVKVQYVKIDTAKLQEKVAENEKLLKDARAFWNKNKQDPIFKRPDDEPTSQPDDATSQPTSKPATKPAYFTRWEEAKDAAIKALREQRAAESARELADWLVRQSAEPWHGVAEGSDGYKAPPASAAGVDFFETLLKSAPAGSTASEAVSVTTTDWLSPDKVNDEPGIGTATFPNPGGVSLSFRQLAFTVQGLATIPTGEESSGVDRNMFLSRYQASRYPLTDDDGNLYVFRVIEVDAERAPRDLAEVREQVVADLRRARGYAEAERAAEKIREKAAADGLAAAWEADAELKDKVTRYNEREEAGARKAGLEEPSPFSRRSFGSAEYSKFVAQIGEVNEAFLDACFALSGHETAVPKVKSIAMPDSGTVVVVEWVKDVPADQNTFAAMRTFLSGQIQRSRQESYLASWIDPQAIRSRNKFEFKSSG